MDELLEHLNIIADPNVLYMIFSHSSKTKLTIIYYIGITARKSTQAAGNLCSYDVDKNCDVDMNCDVI